MVTVFCIRHAGEREPVEVALPEGGRVRLVEEEDLGAWIADGALPSTLEAVRAHDAVVRAALRSATPVPARFGTVFPSEAELRASLRERRDSLLASLGRVAGRVEMGVRVEWTADAEAEARAAPDEPVRSGRDYLEARRREMAEREELRRQAGALLDRVEERLEVEGAPVTRKLLPERGIAGVMAHLVHRRSAGVYRVRVEEARSAFPHVHLHLTGPWAPYSFV